MAAVTLEEFYKDPEMHHRLQEAARRERARLMRAWDDRTRNQTKRSAR